MRENVLGAVAVVAIIVFVIAAMDIVAVVVRPTILPIAGNVRPDGSITSFVRPAFKTLHLRSEIRNRTEQIEYVMYVHVIYRFLYF